MNTLLTSSPLLQKLAENEVQRSMQLFGVLMSSLERSQAGLLEVTEINRRSVEHQAEVMIRELEQEITELRTRSTALAKLAKTENFVTGLKVCNVSREHTYALGSVHQISFETLQFSSII